jgi:hypothetical protein
MNLNEVHKAVGKIKSQLFKKSNSHSIGMLKSHFRGSGLQFKEHRVYTHGDDVRFIDWKLVAKMNTPYVKTFEEERNVEIAVVLDATPSMFYGHKGISKLQAAIEITCLLYLLAAETKDYIHVIVVGEEVFDIPKGNGDKGISQLIIRLNKAGIVSEKGSVNLAYQYGDFSSKGLDATIMKHLSRNRELIFLSGWDLDLEKVKIERILYRKRSHCFRFLAPIDKGNKEIITLKGNSSNNGGGGVVTFNSKKQGKALALNSRIKDIGIENDYLESFIREMI